MQKIQQKRLVLQLACYLLLWKNDLMWLSKE